MINFTEMNLEDLENQYIVELRNVYTENEAKELFSLAVDHFLNIPKFKLLLSKDQDLEYNHIDELILVLKDLKLGKPVQYVLNEAHFLGLKFRVNADVLIPRPETEELVDWIISDLSMQENLHLLDIGTGSGCIPITIKKNRPNLEVSSLDVSTRALSIARENALKYQTKINFIEASILDYTSNEKYNIIVSNPPYVRELEKQDMEDHVLNHEPALALFVSNDDPLIFYKAIADFAKTNLEVDGKLYFEINSYLGKETVDMLSTKGFKNIVLRKDMQGNDRMICAMI